jgi:hypothetical protein
VQQLIEAKEMDLYFGLELVWILFIAFYVTWKSGKATGAREERERRKRIARQRRDTSSRGYTIAAPPPG